MSRSGIGWINQTEANLLGLTGQKSEIGQRKTFTRSEANMDLTVTLRGFNTKRASKCRELLFSRDDRMAHHEMMITLSLKIEINVITNAIGPDVIHS